MLRLAVVLWAGCALGAGSLLAQTGPAVGALVPDFQAADQDGVLRTPASLMGPNGLMLVFFRSADW